MTYIFQAFDSDNPTYDEDSVLMIASNVSNSTPAIATTVINDEEVNLTIFKMADESVHFILIDSNFDLSTDVFFPSSLGEKIQQLQFTSDFKYLALTLNNNAPDKRNAIDLYSRENEEFTTLYPKSISYTENAEGLPFEYIDAIAFDATNRRLAFDYLICSSQDSELAPGCAWQVGIYDMVNGTFEYPFARLDRDVSVGNPSFAKVKSNYITFDLFVREPKRSEVWVLNTENGEVDSISSSVTSSVTSLNYRSRPSFTQDDSGLIFSVLQSDNEGYLYYHPLINYSDVENDNGDYINDVNRAAFPNTASINFVDARPSLTLSDNAIEFGEIISEAQAPICMSNSTTYPIKIYTVNNELDALNLGGIPNYISGVSNIVCPF